LSGDGGGICIHKKWNGEIKIPKGRALHQNAILEDVNTVFGNDAISFHRNHSGIDVEVRRSFHMETSGILEGEEGYTVLEKGRSLIKYHISVSAIHEAAKQMRQAQTEAPPQSPAWER
jgi:hypothetical protein